MFQFQHLHIENYRCFENVDISFEPDLTIFWAENGGGKSAILTALAMGLAFAQPRPPKELKLNPEQDVRRIPGAGLRREPAGSCTVEWTAREEDSEEIRWLVSASALSGRSRTDTAALTRSIEKLRAPGLRWPLFGFYGTGRFAAEKRPGVKIRDSHDRWDAYSGCLTPSATEGPLRDWLQAEILSDYTRKSRGEPERLLAQGAFATLRRAIPELADIWFEPAESDLMFKFKAGNLASWRELSDGYHVFVCLVADIARRALILNDQDGPDAPRLVEGVVLIDEIDLHLHPRWQRNVLGGLREAFPKLQLIITSHSPQVLSSAENRQARLLESWALVDKPVYVEGRDSNAILLEMKAGSRDDKGMKLLAALHRAIDESRLQEARELMARLKDKWGIDDPALIRAEGFVAELEEGND